MAVRLALSFFGTLSLDQGTFISWSMNLAKNGFHGFYNGWSDYLPGYLYVLWFLGKIKLILPGIPEVLLYKLPAILSDLATGYLIYKILKGSKGEKWGIIGAVIYLFNPAIFANSTLWGQVDSLTALFSLLTIYLLPTNYFLSAIYLSIGTLIKPQAVFILPVIVFLMFKNKWSFPKFSFYGLISAVTFVLGFVPFVGDKNIISFIFERLNVSLNQYVYTSVNAFNFWGIFGFWKPDLAPFQYGGYLIVFILIIYLSFKIWKIKNAQYFLLSFVFIASFIFFTRMHERHLLPLFAPLAIVAVENPFFLIPYWGLSLTYVANLFYSYFWITNDFIQVFPDFVVKFFSALNVGAVIFIFYSLAKNLSWDWSKITPSVKEHEFVKVKLSKKSAKIILACILTFAFATRVFELGSPPKEYFDEVYHAFTAKVMLGLDPSKAWEWWNTPPEGFAYEWTHPPLAKLGMVAGMKIFGENSFGWRFPGAVLGTLSVYLIYLIAKHLFKDELVGIISASVYSLDGLPLVMSRIGMNDSYFLFFALASIYLFMTSRNFLSAITFGLSLASKWSAIWVIPILFILWLKREKKFSISIFLSFIILPAGIYLLTYLPMFLTGHDLSTWWGMQKQMWWYHTGLKATHPYTSSWWSWPFMIRPIYLYTSEEIGGWVSRIYSMGNPLVFWFGLSSIIMSFIFSFVERNKKLGFIVFCYLIFFVPWALSPRIMFFYHYLPSVPFLAIATGYVLRRNPKLILGYLFIGLLVFIYFYSHWAGLQVPLWLDRSYYWISSWR
ncbi:MAG: glycosyltransferase family 39 protein [bacterium]|nr:glycosyltransferase family 39 protein [bacterium]